MKYDTLISLLIKFTKEFINKVILEFNGFFEFLHHVSHLLEDFTDVNKKLSEQKVIKYRKIRMNFDSEVIKLKVQLDNLIRVPTVGNANAFLSQIQRKKNGNFQTVQDLFLTTLLSLMDGAEGL